MSEENERNVMSETASEENAAGEVNTEPANIDAEVERRMAERQARRSKRSRSRAKQKEKEVQEDEEPLFKLNPIAKAAIVGLVVFAVMTAILVPLRNTGEGSAVVGTVTTIVGSEDETIFEAEERLSTEMTPIYIDESSPFYEAFTDSDRVNVLLLGVNDNMTDTIMLGSYDMENQTIDIISIPRDTYYYRAAYKNANAGFMKINCVYRTEGVVPLAEAVSSILYGMPIHYYAVVEYEDIKKVMDVVGGVEIDIPFAMKYDDTTKGAELHIDIPAGPQKITSANVIEFLRFRHTNPWYASQGYKSYYRGDIDRIEVQQNFVKAFIKECLKFGNVKDVAKVTLENVESDMTFTMATKIAVKALSGFNMDGITSYTLPGTDKTISELSFWGADDDGIYDMLETIYHLKPAEETESGEGSEGEELETTVADIPHYSWLDNAGR